MGPRTPHQRTRSPSPARTRGQTRAMRPCKYGCAIHMRSHSVSTSRRSCTEGSLVPSVACKTVCKHRPLLWPAIEIDACLRSLVITEGGTP
eukprot:9495915-Pyramimonas_sp.AAC.1